MCWLVGDLLGLIYIQYLMLVSIGRYQDSLNEAGLSGSKAYVLVGGIIEWLSMFGEDEGLVARD